MKRIIFSVAAIIAACSFGASYEDWFTPNSGWNNQTVPVNIKVSNWNFIENYPVNTQIGDIVQDLSGWIDEKDIPASAKNAFKLSISALANSIYAACQSQMNKVKIDNLGAALEGMFVSRYGQYQDAAGNVITKTQSGLDTSAMRQQLIANKNAVVSGGQASGGSESNPLKLIITQKPYDERQFEQHVENGNSLTSLKGWYNLGNTGTAIPYDITWAFSLKDFYLPITSGEDDELKWGRWNGWEASCFSAGDDIGNEGNNDKPLHLRHWYGGDGGCGESLQNLLTNKNVAVDRSKHYFLARYGENDAPTHDLHWVSMDESAMEIGGEPEVDDRSIILAQDEGASQNDPKKLKLKGFDEAKKASVESDKVPTIPNIKPNGEDLEWTSFKDFFADSVFKTSETTGKVLLNGTKEGDKKVQVLAVQYGNTDDDQTLSHFSGDNKSIDFGFTPDGQAVESPLAQLHNFDNPKREGASTAYDFADILTNGTVKTAGWYVPLRTDGVLQYAPLSKITTTPAAVDDKTIEINDTDPNNKFLQLHGAAGEGITLEEGDVYQIGKDSKGKFAKLGADSEDAEVTAENASIESYTGNGGGKYFRLRDWMKNREGIPHVLGWNSHRLAYWSIDGSNGIDINGEGGNDQITLSGYLDAEEGSVPYAKKDGNGLGWVANSVDGGGLLMLNTGNAPSTVDIIAGYGMKVTKQSGAIQISSTLDTPDSAGAFSSITYISNIEYDTETHSLKVTKTTVSAKILNDGTSQEQTVFIATPHSAEHPSELK